MFTTQVRAAREEGTVRVAHLEEALTRLGAAARAGGAGEVGVEATRLAAEAGAAKRGEARARAELSHLKELLAIESRRVSEMVAELVAREHQLAQLWVYAAFGPAAAPEFAPPPVPVGVPAPVGPGRHSVPPAPHAQLAANAVDTGARGVDKAQQRGSDAEWQGRLAGAPGASAAGVSCGDGGVGEDGGKAGAGTAVLLDPALERRLRRQYDELVTRQKLIAKLSEDLDAARAEAEAARGELAQARAALPDASQPEGAQWGDLRRKLAACEVCAARDHS